MIEVAYVAHLGTDLLTANAARRSFDNGHTEWSETPRGRRGRSDPRLVSDLAADGHYLPFRHCHVTLACTAPLPVARQLGKHQVGFSWSEVSRRYKTKGLTFHEIEVWRSDVADRRQGSGGALDERTNALLRQAQDRIHAECLRAYDYALTLGASAEQARFLLPQSMDVSWTWTGSLLGWWSMVQGRSHPDAQAETREFAQRVEEVVGPLFPVSWASLAGWRPSDEVAA